MKNIVLVAIFKSVQKILMYRLTGKGMKLGKKGADIDTFVDSVRKDGGLVKDTNGIATSETTRPNAVA